MKLERSALKALIKESIQNLVQEQDPASDSPGDTGEFEATGSGAAAVNTMMKRLRAQKPIMDMLVHMAGKQEALVAVAVIAKTLGVEIAEYSSKLKILQDSVKSTSE